MNNKNQIVLKTLALFGILSMPAGLHASYQARAVSLPAAPVALPARISPVSAVFPSAMPVSPAASLPGASSIYRLPATLPALPIPVIGGTRISLPAPARNLPASPTTIVGPAARYTMQSVRLVSFAAASAETAQDTERARERLGRVFDKGARKDDNENRETGRPRGDSSRLTLPESDLLEEIGVQTLQ